MQSVTIVLQSSAVSFSSEYLDQGIDKSPNQLPPHPSSSPDGAGLIVLPSARRILSPTLGVKPPKVSL